VGDSFLCISLAGYVHARAESNSIAFHRISISSRGSASGCNRCCGANEKLIMINRPLSMLPPRLDCFYAVDRGTSIYAGGLRGAMQFRARIRDNVPLTPPTL
jgi:hypothetical protein